MVRERRVAVIERKGSKGAFCGPKPPVRPERSDHTALPEVRLLPIGHIRTDGDTQHRIAPNPKTVQEYAELMCAGVEFPPVDVRWDGNDYWLSDGFQRMCATRLANVSEIRAAIRPGGREDAQWDSYAANATHGLRRSAAETKKVIQLALQHPTAAKMSNVQIAKHLHITESTVRYWRQRLSSQGCEDSVLATRGGTTYALATCNLGKRNRENGREKPHRDLRGDLIAAKEKSSPTVRLLLNIIEHWVQSSRCGSAEFLDAIERYLWSHRTEFVEPPIQPRSSSAAAATGSGFFTESYGQ